MFNAPKIFSDIPDIAKIYELNDQQGEDLDRAVEEMDSNIFLDAMNESTIQRWEKILGITPMEDDLPEERRFRVKIKVLEKLPFSYRVIIDKLNALCGEDGYVMEFSDDRTRLDVKLQFGSQKMVSNVEEMLDRIVPLNMYVGISNCLEHKLTGQTYSHGTVVKSREVSVYSQTRTEEVMEGMITHSGMITKHKKVTIGGEE